MLEEKRKFDELLEKQKEEQVMQQFEKYGIEGPKENPNVNIDADNYFEEVLPDDKRVEDDDRLTVLD